MTKYPKDWVVTSLEAIGSIKSGGTPLRKTSINAGREKCCQEKYPSLVLDKRVI